MPLTSEVISARARMNLHTIMDFNCDWNEEVVAQFYATLHVDRGHKIFHWSLQGKPFQVEYAQFAAILGFS